MKMLLPLLMSLAMLFAAPALRADEAADKAQVRQLENDCAAVLVKGDYEALADLLGKDWVMVDASGQVVQAADIYKDLKSGDLKFAAYEMGEMDIRVVGDTAVVIGRAHSRGMWHGEFFNETEVFTDTFVRVDGKWRCLVSHGTEVEAEPEK